MLFDFKCGHTIVTSKTNIEMKKDCHVTSSVVRLRRSFICAKYEFHIWNGLRCYVYFVWCWWYGNGESRAATMRTSHIFMQIKFLEASRVYIYIYISRLHSTSPIWSVYVCVCGWRQCSTMQSNMSSSGICARSLNHVMHIICWTNNGCSP